MITPKYRRALQEVLWEVVRSHEIDYIINRLDAEGLLKSDVEQTEKSFTWEYGVLTTGLPATNVDVTPAETWFSDPQKARDYVATAENAGFGATCLKRLVSEPEAWEPNDDTE